MGKQPAKSTTNVPVKNTDVTKKEQEIKGGVIGFFGGGKAKEQKVEPVRDLSKLENKIPTKTEVETKSNIIGFFKGGKAKEQKEVTKAEQPERSSVFSFFGRASNKEDPPKEATKEVIEEKPEVKVKSQNKPKQISVEAQKMSVITTFRGAEPKPRKHSDELPDLEAADVAAATIKIQSAYKGFKTRQMIKQHKEIMPDLNCAQVQDATIKIQSAYRGFKTRKDMKESGEDTQQRRNYSSSEDSSDSSDTESDEVEDLPDLKAADVVDATIKIQSAYKCFKARKMIKQHKEIMPDLNCAQVQDATLKIQSAYRGFKTRKDMKEAGEELPDLKAADVVEATIKIQSAYKGFKTRQMIKKHQEILPDLNCAQVQDATVKIQSAYRGFKTRQELREKDDSVSDSSDSSEPESQQRGKDSSDSSATESEDDSKKPTRVNSVKRAQAIKNQKGTMRRRVPDSSATESDAIESMPDTDADEEENMYTPKPRREVPDSSATESEVGEGEDMPDLDDSDVENATIKIQTAFRGFQARKNVTKPKPVAKKPKFEDIVHAAITIQRAYRRYNKKKQDGRT